MEAIKRVAELTGPNKVAVKTEAGTEEIQAENVVALALVERRNTYSAR